METSPGTFVLEKYVTRMRKSRYFSVPLPSKRTYPMAAHEFHIEKLVNGGFGLSHDQNDKVTLIEGVIAEERVSAKITSENKNLQKARPLQIITPSSHRVQPACKYYKQCGGCDFQHMSYSRQVESKGAIVRDLLCRSGNQALIHAAEQQLSPPLASKLTYHYRQRIRLQVDEQQTLGFYKRRSNDCVPIDLCLLAGKEINACLAELRQHPALQRLLPRAEALEMLFNPATVAITLMLHFIRKPRPADKQHAALLESDITGLEHVFFTGKDFAPSGNSSLSFTIPACPPHTDAALKLLWESGGFCQVNLTQNQTLITTVLNFCRVSTEDSVLDLFCGMGNFSIPLAERAKSVLGIEGQGSAIRSARKNSETAGQSNTRFLKKPVHKACLELAAAGTQFDIVVIDPPRQGAPGIAKQLVQLTGKRLIYISCDPATLCRDLAQLADQGLHLHKLQPIDMFPQTHHIECVALLEKSPENH